MTEVPTGWRLLHSSLPKAALRELSRDVYGVSGLTDVNEGYLIQRLFASGLPWSWRVIKQEFISVEDRQVRDKDYTNRYYLAAVQGRLTIDGTIFDGSGASDNRKVDAAFKGANTVAFKNACKMAGMTAELYMDGRAIDTVYDLQDKRQKTAAQQSAEVSPATPTEHVQRSAHAPTDGPPSVGADERSAATPPPPPTGGARAKRSNVVPAATKPATATQTPPPPTTQAAPPASQDGVSLLADDPVDDGRAIYERDLREALRLEAAKLYRLQVIYKNKVANAARSDLWEAVPDASPNPGSNTALANLLGSKFPGRTLAELDAGQLQVVIDIVGPFIAKRTQQLTEKGIGVE